jgi:hypothetical protein
VKKEKERTQQKDESVTSSLAAMLFFAATAGWPLGATAGGFLADGVGVAAVLDDALQNALSTRSREEEEEEEEEAKKEKKKKKRQRRRKGKHMHARTLS